MRFSDSSLAIAMLLIVGCFERAQTSKGAPQTDNTSVLQSSQPTKAADNPAKDPAVDAPVADGAQEALDAMALYRQAQILMKGGKQNEGYTIAKKALKQFIAEGADLPWMLLESDTADDRRVDVHFNMGPRERNMPDNGIVKPLSFRIWSTGNEPELLQIIDFEIGRVSGESLTAAIGETSKSGHANYGILAVDAAYEEIKKSVMDVISQKQTA